MNVSKRQGVLPPNLDLPWCPHQPLQGSLKEGSACSAVLICLVPCPSCPPPLTQCDNILVNGTSGQVKIADLGLASCQRGMSVVGTPGALTAWPLRPEALR